MAGAIMPAYINQFPTSPSWNEITGKPTFALVAETGNFSDITNKPTTVAGYGITDAVDAQKIQSGVLIYNISTGLSNTYSVNLTPAPTSYSAGMMINFKASSDNTGPASININGLGAKSIKKLVTSNLDPNDIKNGQMVSVIYDGTNFQLLSIPYTLIYNNPNSITHGVQNISATGSTIFTVPAGSIKYI